MWIQMNTPLIWPERHVRFYCFASSLWEKLINILSFSSRLSFEDIQGQRPDTFDLWPLKTPLPYWFEGYRSSRVARSASSRRLWPFSLCPSGSARPRKHPRSCPCSCTTAPARCRWRTRTRSGCPGCVRYDCENLIGHLPSETMRILCRPEGGNGRMVPNAVHVCIQTLRSVHRLRFMFYCKCTCYFKLCLNKKVAFHDSRATGNIR